MNQNGKLAEPSAEASVPALNDGGAPADNPALKLWKAGELARHTGLTRQSLHQYVLLGLLNPAGMTPGGQRLFDPKSVERIKLIRDLCHDNGYTLKEVRDIFFKRQEGAR